MNTHSLLVKRTDSIRAAMERLSHGGRGIVLVVDGANRLETTITDGDVRRAILGGLSPEAQLTELIAHKAQTLGSVRPVVALAGTPSAELLPLFREAGVRNIPLLDKEGILQDLVSLDDFLPTQEQQSQAQPIQAVIMAGGFGRRMRPLTDHLPKPMLPIGGKPLLERTIGQLRESGIRQIHVTTHFMPEKITQYFGNGRRFGVDLHYVSEERPLGTAGSLGLLAETEEPLLVINGDILTTVDFRAMLAFHREHAADLTLGVRHYQVEVPYGVIEADNGRVTGIKEKPTFDWMVSAGVYILEPAARRRIPAGERFDMPDLIAALLAERCSVASFPVIEYWMDIGQPGDFETAQRDVRSLRAAA